MKTTTALIAALLLLPAWASTASAAPDDLVDVELAAHVDKGLPEAKFRLCTQVSSFTHQLVRDGAEDDCARFTVAAP